MPLVPEDDPLERRTDQVNVADRAAKVAVEEMLKQLGALGIDVENQLRSQKAFMILRAVAEDDEFMDDLMFLRNVRKGVGKVTDVGVATIVKTIVAFGLILLGLGTKEWWVKHIIG